MKVFKFGGASVKDAHAIKNLAAIVKQYAGTQAVIVISAMGKTTNALEVVVSDYLEGSSALDDALSKVRVFHETIISELFLDSNHAVYHQFENTFKTLHQFLETNTSKDYDFVYDQIIGFGELFSTQIISQYLSLIGLTNTWLDARMYIKTNANYRRATVDFKITERLIAPLAEKKQLVITQGFIASDSKHFTTTLGREGSDYTAAIFAACLQAESVTIWKDVAGVLNADPRYFKNAQLLDRVSYSEAIELAFYGASVIHPKTLQPLQQKSIPLVVKSFLEPEKSGTLVHNHFGVFPEMPCYIVKKNQILITLSSLDFSYIVEDNISDIFKILHLFKMKVDLIQNSAISFSVCVDDMFHTIDDVVNHLQVTFKVSCISPVSLYTVRHFNAEAITHIEANKDIVLKQRTQDTLQIVTK